MKNGARQLRPTRRLVARSGRLLGLCLPPAPPLGHRARKSTTLRSEINDSRSTGFEEAEPLVQPSWAGIDVEGLTGAGRYLPAAER